MIRRALLALAVFLAVVVLGVAGAAWWAWRQQTALLITTANQLLSPYGITIQSIHGLATGLQSSRVDRVDFTSIHIDGNHHIYGLTLDYEPRLLLQGQVDRLQAQTIELNPEHTHLPQGAAVTINTLDIRCSAADQCQGNLGMRAEVAQLRIPDSDLSADTLSWQANANIRYEGPVIRVDLPPGMNLTLGSASTPDFVVEQSTLNSQQVWRLNINLDEQLLVADGGLLALHMPVIRHLTEPAGEPAGLSGFELTLDRLNGSYDFSQAPTGTQAGNSGNANWSDRLNGQAAFSAEKLYTSLLPFNLWSYRWKQQIRWSPAGVLETSLTGSLATRELLTLSVTQDFNSRQGRASVTTPTLAFTPSTLSLRDILSPLPFDADLIEGDLRLQAEFGWQMPADLTSVNTTSPEDWQIHGAVSTQARNLAGYYEDTAFAGLSTLAHWQLEPDLTVVNRESAQLELRELNPGIALHNIRTRYYYNQKAQRLDLQDTALTVFGGTVTSAQPITINLAERSAGAPADSVFTLTLNGIDISQILSVGAYRQVSASGLIDGTLPISLKGLAPTVSGGQLQARAPGGSIRYDSGTTVSGNQSLDLVYQALRHYQYESLNTSVDYAESGELTLAMQLQGVSPELNQGQRINLNLNISDNIPALLQSLQAANNINERLQELLEQQ